MQLVNFKIQTHTPRQSVLKVLEDISHTIIYMNAMVFYVKITLGLSYIIEYFSQYPPHLIVD